MKQDQTGKIWFRNKLIGYIDKDTGDLYGINPLSGNAMKIKNWNGLNAVESLKKWLKPLRHLMV